MASPEILRDIRSSIPPLEPPQEKDPIYKGDFEDFAADIYEWLSLVMLNSPRIDPNDKIDPVLSRYSVPGDLVIGGKLVKITWRGFISPAWTHSMLVSILLAFPQDAWFGYCVSGFPIKESKDCMILKIPDAAGEYFLWDIA